MGWLEFSVIVGCGLLGFIIVNAVIDFRRNKDEKQSASGASKEDKGTGKDEETAKKSRQQRTGSQESPPRSWWEVLNVDRDASPAQIKEAFRKEISKYHPDRVEGLGLELRELADRKAKEVNHAYTLAKEHRGFN